MSDAPTITIWVNGQTRQVSVETTVETLLLTLGLPDSGVAVALDQSVVPRAAHATTALDEAARVEVIRAVGGG